MAQLPGLNKREGSLVINCTLRVFTFTEVKKHVVEANFASETQHWMGVMLLWQVNWLIEFKCWIYYQEKICTMPYRKRIFVNEALATFPGNVKRS